MKKRLLLLAVVAILVVGLMPVTAFATGEYLEHDGWSTVGYYTDDYVEQRYDNHMYCDVAEASVSGMQVYPVMYDGGWVRLTDNVTFSTGLKFTFLDWSYVRHIHLRIVNAGAAEDVYTHTHGEWSLEP